MAKPGIDWDVFGDDVKPGDIRQGKIANSYFLAALAGIAE